MAPALHVTHVLAFTLTDIAPYMRIVRLSNGPTLNFRIERYSLMKDIIASSRHAKHLSSIESMSAPLVRPLCPPFFKGICQVVFLFIYKARPRVLPCSWPYHSATPNARNENVPDPLPPARAAQARTLIGAARRPCCVQRGPRYHRLAALSHHRQALRRLATCAPRLAGHGRHDDPQWRRWQRRGARLGE